MNSHKFVTTCCAICVLLTVYPPKICAQEDGPEEALALGPTEHVIRDVGGGASALNNIADLINLKDARGFVTKNPLGEEPNNQLDGNGLTVVVIDSGLYVDHHDFRGDGKIKDQVNLIPHLGGVPEKATDSLGHGTHVAGIIVANGMHKGIAPNANVIPIKVLDSKGKLENEDRLRKALEYVLEHHVTHNISAVNISIAFPMLEDKDNYAAGTTRADIKLLVEQLRGKNIAVVCAAGNEFKSFNDARAEHKLKQGMGFPAIIGNTISVGAVYGQSQDVGKTHNPYREVQSFSIVQDQIAPFSNRLHDSCNPACRTDVFAPGGLLVKSTGIKSATGESHYAFGGTSQAAPVVTGVVLLLQQYYRDSMGGLPKVDLLEKWIRKGVRIHDGDDEYDQVRHTCGTFFRIDAYQALLACHGWIRDNQKAPQEGAGE